MYLQLSVAGHLTIFLTRTRGPLWSTRPAPILLIAVVGTQALATLICLFGFSYDPSLVGLGRDGLGLCLGMVPVDRSSEAARISDSRSGHGGGKTLRPSL